MPRTTEQCIADALERAARYRRMQAPPEWQGRRNLDEVISWQHRWQPVALADGWWEIGAVHDTLTPFGEPLDVFWHPQTDAVKVQRPRPVPPPPPPPVPPPPLRQTVNAWYAEPGFVYAYQGRDYTPEQAAALASRTGVGGWTWRRES